MKYVLPPIVLVLLLICGVVLASNPGPSPPNGAIQYDSNGKFAPYLIGPGLGVITSGSDLYLTVTNAVPENAIIEENGPAITTENGVTIIEE